MRERQELGRRSEKGGGTRRGGQPSASVQVSLITWENNGVELSRHGLKKTCRHSRPPGDQGDMVLPQQPQHIGMLK